MAVDYCFNFPLPNGLHGRPASHFEALTSKFRSKITLIHERTCFRANARSVLSMVSADIKRGDPCRVQIVGDDEQPAMEALRSFVKDVLPHCDEVLPELPSSKSEEALPRSLKAAGLKSFLRGRAVSGGVGWGEVVVVGKLALPSNLEHETAGDLKEEHKKALRAIADVSAAMAEKILNSRHAQETQVLRTHTAIVNDVALADMIAELILSKRRTAAQAISDACTSFTNTLRSAESEYLRERTLDIEDVCSQLMDRVLKRTPSRMIPKLLGPSICIADHLTPGQFLSLDRNHLKGLVLGEGGTTSHTVILARSMNVPTLVGVPGAVASLQPGKEVLVDAEIGLLISELPEGVRRYYAMERDTLDRHKQQLSTYQKAAGRTADGHDLEVAANIASDKEVSAAIEGGAQGIGLFRTEMLFMDRDEAPSEQEQTEIYTAAARDAQGHPVIIRLLDIGGDKPAPYLKLEREDNPFLGYRGVRLYPEFSQLIKAQVRSILRASSAGQVKILVPMVSCLEEVRDIKRMIAEAAQELAASGYSCGPVPLLGIMLEVPSVAFLMPELCAEVDFFSIGSNDLIQYFLAADRANEKVAPLYTWAHPALLRLLKSLVSQAHSHGKWIGLCGEMGDAPSALPLLIGLGLDEISLSVPRITAMKAAISNARFSQCQSILERALMCSTRDEVESLLKNSIAVGTNSPLISADLVFDADCLTKEEVIKQMSARLYLAGRTDRPRLLEEAIWKREDTYSTGFGYGLALPHCRSEHLTANTIVIARLKQAVDWGSLDDKPVDVVILLAVRSQDEAQAHMRVFARLSRLVMREEFRESIRRERDPNGLAVFIEQSLGLDLTAV